MPPPIVTYQFDFTSLTKAIDLALRTTSQKLPLFLGSKAYQIAWRAGKYTPFVPISRIDTELDEPAVFRNGRKNTAGLTQGDAIVLARMNPDSRYNQLTDRRWAISGGMAGLVKGYGHLAKNIFWDRVQGYEERQKAARHSSTHYLQSGWKAVKLALRLSGFRAGKGYTAVDAGDDREGNNLPSTQRFGAVIQGGSDNNRWIRIENTVGMEGTPNLAYSRNQALHDYGGPALQRAVEEVAAIELRDWNLKKGLAADLVAAWQSVPDARPQAKPVRHNTLGNYLDAGAMSSDADAPFSR